jgi:hypothetical protein
VSRPRFLADEDLRYEIVLAVRRREPAVEFPTVRDFGRTGATNADVLALAQADGWIVVSHDVSTLRAEADRRVRDGPGVAGVLLTPQHSLTRDVAECLVLIWTASEAEEWRDRVVFIPF